MEISSVTTRLTRFTPLVWVMLIGNFFCSCQLLHGVAIFSRNTV